MRRRFWFGALLATVAAASLYQLNPQAKDRPDRLSIAQSVLSEESSGHAKALGPRPLKFTDDHGPHPAFRSEWWYFTGNLEANDKRQFGYQFTIFRQSTSATEIESASDWKTNQVYMGHVALTDVESGQFRSEERFSRAALGLAGGQDEPFKVWVENWATSGRSSTACRGCLDIEIRVNATAFSFVLELKSEKPVVLHGDRGFSRKGDAPGNASHYYSLTRLATRGTVVMEGLSHQVSGSSWMDHEWSTSSLDADTAGWDWISLQLDDNREIMYYRLRGRDGGSRPASEGTFVDQAGVATRLHQQDVNFAPLRHWVSPDSGIRYPVEWKFEIPGRSLTLELTPLLDNQERLETFLYWEGAIIAHGSENGKPISGRGYLELVGYE